MGVRFDSSNRTGEHLEGRMQIDCFCVFHWFHFIAGWQKWRKSEAKISPCRFGKCVLNRFMALLRLESCPREETIISKMNLKFCRKWCFRPCVHQGKKLYVMLERRQVGFQSSEVMLWEIPCILLKLKIKFYDLSKFAVLQQMVKSRFCKCQDCVGTWPFFFDFIHYKKKNVF